MLLEGAGAVTAAAGGFVLRQALKISVTTTHTNERTMTVGGDATGNFNQGDVGGNAIFTVGTAPPPVADRAFSKPSPTPRKRSVGLIVLGALLIIAGVMMICTGLYVNLGSSTV